MATKKREIYARAAVQLRTHERALRAERACPGAMGMYLFLLLDARGEETAGDVAEVVALASWGGGERYRAKQIEALVAVGLIERREDRLLVTKYDEHNDTPADISAARSRARERMQAVRANKQRTPPELGGAVPRTSPDVPISSSISISGSDREGVQGEGVPAAPDSSAARYREAYAAGISRGKCAPWVWPGTKTADWDLGKIISGHAKDPSGKGYRGAQLLRFIEATAAEFSSDVIARGKAQYYSAFEPRGCLRWLNEVELAEEARRVG